MYNKFDSIFHEETFVHEFKGEAEYGYEIRSKADTGWHGNGKDAKKSADAQLSKGSHSRHNSHEGFYGGYSKKSDEPMIKNDAESITRVANHYKRENDSTYGNKTSIHRKGNGDIRRDKNLKNSNDRKRERKAKCEFAFLDVDMI